jgi:hypothetical protein
VRYKTSGLKHCVKMEGMSELWKHSQFDAWSVVRDYQFLGRDVPSVCAAGRVAQNSAWSSLRTQWTMPLKMKSQMCGLIGFDRQPLLRG